MPLTSEQDRKLNEVHEYVVGTPQQPGLVGRVDRLEQRAKFSGRLASGVLGAILTGLGIWIGEILSKLRGG